MWKVWASGIRVRRHRDTPNRRTRGPDEVGISWRPAASENDGRMNYFGVLRTSMVTWGYVDPNEFPKAEVMVAPTLQSEGKSLQRPQVSGMER